MTTGNTKSTGSLLPAQETVAPTRVASHKHAPRLAAAQHDTNGIRPQQAAGNMAMQRALQSGTIQAKLNVNAPGDPFEREADRMAEHVVSASTNPQQCPCGGTPDAGGTCPTCNAQQPAVHRFAAQPPGNDAGAAPPSVEYALTPQGHALNAETLSQMGNHFGHDFSGVRVHTDPQASDSARDINALAYTHGNNIVFAQGQYRPESHEGKHLLAHELTHVVQQGGGNQNLNRSAGGVQRQHAPSPPTIKQGPIGDVIIPITDWQFLEPRDITKEWKAAIDETTFFAVPVPELGVRLDVRGKAGASALFNAGVEGALRNIHVGISNKQAAAVAASSLIPGVPAFIPSGSALRYGLGPALTFSDFRALADIDLNAHVSLSLHFNAELKVAASLLGAFDIADVSTFIFADATAGVDLKYLGQIGLYYDNRRLDFRFNSMKQAGIHGSFTLGAGVGASLLGFKWKKSWILAQKDIGYVWTVGAPLAVNYNNGSTVTLPLDPQNLPILSVIQQMFAASGTAQSLLPAGAGGGGQPPPAGGGGSGGGTPGSPSAPTGRTPSDPIEMRWFKSPGLYPIHIQLGGTRYFFTEPEAVKVPDEPGLADIRRNANTNGEIIIGVSPSSKNYPEVGQSVYPRVRVGEVRGGVKQRQFRRLLLAHGYDCGARNEEADHVRDLQWAGRDEYDNLWPLAAAHNSAANQILRQMVTYRDDSGQVVTVPLEETPLNRHFRIIGFS